MSCPQATARHRRAERVFFFKMALILSFILPSATDSRLFGSSPTAELAFFTSLSSLLATPAHHSKEQNAGYLRLIEDLQEPVAHAERSESKKLFTEYSSFIIVLCNIEISSLLDNTVFPTVWERPFLFQHDNAPLHKARSIIMGLPSPDLQRQ